jgi:hypothetical protein
MSAELPKDISSLDLAGEESKKFTGQQFCSWFIPLKRGLLTPNDINEKAAD